MKICKVLTVQNTSVFTEPNEKKYFREDKRTQADKSSFEHAYSFI